MGDKREELTAAEFEAVINQTKLLEAACEQSKRLTDIIRLRTQVLEGHKHEELTGEELEAVINQTKLLEAECERSKRLTDIMRLRTQLLEIATAAMKAENERLMVESEQMQEIINVLEQDAKGSLSC